MTAVAQINLMPREIDAERSVQRTKFGVAIGFGVLVVVLAALVLVKLGQVSSAQTKLETQEQVNASLQGQINDPALQSVVAKQADLQAKTTIVATQLAGELSLPRLLNEFSVAVPTDTSMNTLSVTRGAIGATAEAGPAGEERPSSAGAAELTASTGTFTVDGAGACGHPDAAAWLTHVSSLQSVEDAWIDSSAKEANASSADNKACALTTFSARGDLSAAVLTARSIVAAQGELP